MRGFGNCNDFPSYYHIIENSYSRNANNSDIISNNLEDMKT